MKVEHIAELCHEANRVFCAQNGDESQKSWRDAGEWQRQSAITGVRFALAHPEATPEIQHEAWLKDKQRDGWVYGAVKDPAKREHPCMVPHGELPEFQRMKDNLFQSVVRCFRETAEE